MNIMHAEIERYLKQYSAVHEPVIAEMEEYGRSVSFPIVGPLVGRLLQQYARISGATRILELGSGFGYSAAWFFMAAPANVRIICTELSGENVVRGREYMARLGAAGCVRFLQGNALELLDTIDGNFDIIFNDIDKEAYPGAFEKGFPHLRRGGLFISDNVLWKGKVAQGNPDKETRGIMEYNRMIFNSPEALSTIIPLRDGISVSVKI